MVMAALPRLVVASGQCVVIDPRGSAIACGFSFAADAFELCGGRAA